MIRRLFIANRGEIVVRIARTAHRLGIDTVGVYSEPDRNALHVDVVDVAVSLAGAAPADSYLRSDALVEIALETGCDAVHPGYGFLAESAAFARDVIDAGLTWVGPSPDQIALLGNKVAAKRVALVAGVATGSVYEASPGLIPEGVPIPAMVKAATGGGGRGMRFVQTPDELAEAVASASREAASAFGDGTVFIEPYLERARHVEVQIVGDTHGNVVHLGERECSVQRRNQKLIEEAPSPGISTATREALVTGSLALARHIGYVNAGTVEFLVGDDGTISFLEVNTRLQVEHPVTEAVVGVDLVELQLRVAAGEALPLTQDEIGIDGHTIEARVVAEDPSTGWLPSTGVVEVFDIGDGVRIDSAVGPGSEVSVDYDSLLAKLIVHAPNREDAVRRMARTLRTTRIAGVDTNLETLAAVFAEDDFCKGLTLTSYLGEHPGVLAPPGPQGEDRLALLLGAVFATEQHDRAADAVTGFAPSGWRNLRTTGQRQTWWGRDGEHRIEYVMEGSGARVWIGAWPEPHDDGTLPPDDRRIASVRLLGRGTDRQVIELDGRRSGVDIVLAGDTAQTRSRAGALAWTRVPRFVEHEAEEAGSGPLCPLPGTVIAVHAEPDSVVEDGDVLMVIEAMKMEHQITAGGSATVAEVRFSVGDRVDIGDLLVRLEPIGKAPDRG